MVATEENKDSVISIFVASYIEIWYHRPFHYVPTPRIVKYTGYSEFEGRGPKTCSRFKTKNNSDIIGEKASSTSW